MEEFVVSSCLAGIKCRYNGTCKKNDYVCSLVSEGKAIPMCAEVLGGLSVPREPAEIVGDKVLTKSGKDVTENYLDGARKVLDYCKSHNIKKAISPSIYDVDRFRKNTETELPLSNRFDDLTMNINF